MAGMLAIINASEDDYNKLTAAVNNADGASQQMADTMLDNMNGSFTLLQSAVDGAKIALGERLSPYLREFATWITNKMPLAEDAIGDVMDHVDAKVEDLAPTPLASLPPATSGQAPTFGASLGIAWDKIVGGAVRRVVERQRPPVLCRQGRRPGPWPWQRHYRRIPGAAGH